jgi:hypothetical protein
VTAALASFTFCLSVLVTSPLVILWGNADEFDGGANVPATLSICGAALALAILIFVLLRTIPARAATVAMGIMLTLSTAAWLQSTFFSADLHLLDGRKQQPSVALTWVSTLTWLGLALLALAFRRQLASRARLLCVGLVIVQMVGLVSTKRPPAAFREHPRYDLTTAFTFSQSRNVILLALDSARRDLFLGELAAPTLRRKFDGFVDYSDTLGGFPTTHPSVPLILTGQYYDNRVSVAEFVREVASQSLPARLREAGFRSELFPIAPPTFPPLMADNVVGSGLKPALLVRLGRITFLRLMPSLLRNLAMQKTDLMIKLGQLSPWNSDLAFVEALEREGRVSAATPQFKYYHLHGVHLPYAFNEDLPYQFRSVPALASAHKAAVGTLGVVTRFLDWLRAHDLYNQTMVVITGDHGCPLTPEEEVANSATADAASGFPIAVATPLLLIKPFGAQGAMVEKNTPASLADIAPTILAAVGQRAGNGPGQSLLASSSESRDRRFYFYAWDGNWARGFVPAMHEYVVSGRATESTSWTSSGLVFDPSKGRTEKARYAWGRRIDGTQTEPLSHYIRTGLSNAEPGGTWSDARQVVLAIPVIPTRDALVLEMEVSPFLAPNIAAQELSLLANGIPVGRWTLSSRQRLVAEIPAGEPRPELRLVMTLPNVASPRSQGVGPDVRELGILLHELRISVSQTGNSGVHQNLEH